MNRNSDCDVEMKVGVCEGRVKTVAMDAQRVINLDNNGDGSFELKRDKGVANPEGLIWFCEWNTRNRWRDGQVCPDVDKELWSLGLDGSCVFWRWTSVSRCGQGTMAPWARRLGDQKTRKEKEVTRKGEVEEKGTRESGKERRADRLRKAERRIPEFCSVMLTRNPKRE
ncbi:hypothetical protein TNCV_1234521 [Trichonephila clavipes]|nr:hypothetical protein TNCV_1234521 [Trichonephila clavipes]